MPVLQPSALIEDRVAAVRSYHRSTGISRAEVDISGGIDSAVMLAIVCRAIEADQVTAVFTGIHSSDDSRRRAQAAAAATGVPLIDVELTQTFAGLTELLVTAAAAAGHDRGAIEGRMAEDPSVLGSFRSCLRAPVGRALNRMLGGGIRHGTGNECEDRFLRFYQKGGDGEVDSNPIAMLSKGEVFQLARALGVPAAILCAVPSPDLHGTGAAHNDEDELAATYGVAWTYSRIDPESGAYTFLGSIERMSRLLDAPAAEALLFGPREPADRPLRALVEAAVQGPFRGVDPEEVEALLRSARHIEATTRHKWNPNCPTLGDRASLVSAGILTDALPWL